MTVILKSLFLKRNWFHLIFLGWYFGFRNSIKYCLRIVIYSWDDDFSFFRYQLHTFDCLMLFFWNCFYLIKNLKKKLFLIIIYRFLSVFIEIFSMFISFQLDFANLKLLFYYLNLFHLILISFKVFDFDNH